MAIWMRRKKCEKCGRCNGASKDNQTIGTSVWVQFVLKCSAAPTGCYFISLPADLYNQLVIFLPCPSGFKCIDKVCVLSTTCD